MIFDTQRLINPTRRHTVSLLSVPCIRSELMQIQIRKPATRTSSHEKGHVDHFKGNGPICLGLLRNGHNCRENRQSRQFCSTEISNLSVFTLYAIGRKLLNISYEGWKRANCCQKGIILRFQTRFIATSTSRK